MTLELVELTIEQYPDARKRIVRIWLPDDYSSTNTSQRYPVLYMHDGQNLFSTATYGGPGWEVGKTISKLIKEGYTGAIIVGIDNSTDRFNELCPPWNTDLAAGNRARDRFRALVEYEPPKSNEASGDKYAEFIVRTVKPYIDAHYNTLPEREHTGVGGSSMGGLQSLYMGLTYPEVFDYAICFSPALLVIGDKNAESAFDAVNMGNPTILPKLYFYCGAGDPLEKIFVPGCKFAVSELIKRGYPKEKIAMLLDKKQPHNESAWAKYFSKAIKWINGG